MSPRPARLVTVAEAKRFATQVGASHVVILVQYDDDRVAATSYGKTKAQCREAKAMAEAACKAVWNEVDWERGRQC